MTVQRWDRPVRLTALHREHLALGGVMEERSGWLLPISYGNPTGEAAAVRDAAGLSDIGDLGKIDLQGSDLDAVLAEVRGDELKGHAVAVSPPSPKVGEGGRGGEGIDVYPFDGVALRLTEDHALLLTPPEDRQKTFDRVRAAANARECATAVDLTGALCGVRLVGPAAPFVLERLCAVDLTPTRFSDGAVAEAAVARIYAIVTRRDAAWGKSRRYGYDLFVDRDLGAYLWEAILDAGAPLGLRPVGRAGYPLGEET